VAQLTACERIRAYRQCAEIERAFNSACAAYPRANLARIVSETAQAVGLPQERVQAVVQDVIAKGFTDERDYDPNRWNLH